MTNIDEILADVDRLDAAAIKGPWTIDPHGDGCDINCPTGEYVARGDFREPGYYTGSDCLWIAERNSEAIATFRTAAPALAAEVRCLRAKLVEAAIEIAKLFYADPGGMLDASIKHAHKITGIRLKFEDGRFVEEKS